MLETEVLKNPSGDVVVGFKNLTHEDYESLRALVQSPHWATYRRILMSAKDAYFTSCLPMKDPNEVMKQIGLVAGINFAINQAPVLVHLFDQKVKKLVEERIAKEKKGKKPAAPAAPV